MGYNLWLTDRRNLEDYYARRYGMHAMKDQIMIGDDTSLEPISLTIDGVVKSDFTLDEIDSYTCSFKNLQDMRCNFRLFPEYQVFADLPGSLFIASRLDNVDKYQVIFNNPILKKAAGVIREKRKKGLPEFLDRTNEMRTVVGGFLKYAIDDNSKYSFLNCSLFPPHVRRQLMLYEESCRTEKSNDANTHFENIFGYCMNYKTLRSFVVWEQMYLEQCQKVGRRPLAKKPYISTEDRMFRQLREEEDNRIQLLDNPTLEAIDEMRDESGQIDFDLVYSMYDLDDIHKFSDRQLRTIGIAQSSNDVPQKGKKRQ